MMKKVLIFLIADLAAAAALWIFPSFYGAVLSAGDVVFDWLLLLPSDLTIVAAAVLTSLAFVAVRRWTVDQDLAKRCRLDKARLKELSQQAKVERNKAALARYQATVAQISMKLMKLEMLPTLVALLPVGLLAIWSYERLNYLPPQAQQPVEVAFYLPTSACERLIHISPIPGVSAADGWLRPVVADKDKQGKITAGIALWKLTADKPGDYTLRFHFDDKQYEHAFVVGARHYAPTIKPQDETDARIVSEVRLRQRKLFGVVPGTEALGFPGLLDPWLIGYLAIVLPLFFVNKRLFRIE